MKKLPRDRTTDCDLVLREIWRIKDKLSAACGRDMEAGAGSVRLHHSGPQGARPKAEVVADILLAIRERRG